LRTIIILQMEMTEIHSFRFPTSVKQFQRTYNILKKTYENTLLKNKQYFEKHIQYNTLLENKIY